MSRLITFSRYYPKGHPRAGEQTNFVEKIWSSLIESSLNLPEVYIDNYVHFLNSRTKDILLPTTLAEPKGHTILMGNRWKVGEYFSPRVWTGEPYRSKQHQFAPDIKIKKIWSFKIDASDYYLDGKKLDFADLRVIANNDGLATDDFECWFAIHPQAKKEVFQGQILCWNENIQY